MESYFDYDQGGTYRRISNNGKSWELEKGVSLTDFMSGIQTSETIVFDNPSVLAQAIEALQRSGKVSITAPGTITIHDGSWDHDQDVGFWVDKNDTDILGGVISVVLMLNQGALEDFTYTLAEAQSHSTADATPPSQSEGYDIQSDPFSGWQYPPFD